VRCALTNGPLCVADAADALGLHPDTLRDYADRGEIGCYRTPGGHRRFRQCDLDAFVARRLQAAGLTPARAA
jgi:excisionase family DNA binding protein